ncbi:MYG1 family protein [Puniceicoccaceae bacterium K14]|nr:MYG1 family protein [Puniceicoccaceae bacterium K14]
MTFEKILTHPGGAHKDEFLACSVLLAIHPVPIVRGEPQEEDLENPQTCVVDVGHQHEPNLLNFDHHQFPKDHIPTCSLSLVLQHIGIYEEAKSYCDWLETAEWMDCRGPNETAKKLEIDRAAMAKLNSAIDITLIRRFSAQNRLDKGNPIWEIMKMIGEDLLHFINTLKERVEHIERTVKTWEFEVNGETKIALFLPRTDPLINEPSMGVGQYIEANQLADKVLAIISGDRRSEGYGLSRFNDNPAVDLSCLESESDVHFAHVRGFVAKTTATSQDRLKELLSKGIVA